jgi:hypothetical protein
MFQFPTFASHLHGISRPAPGWVAPFGYLRIKGYLHLPEAFRSLSRPSSPLRAKASTYSLLVTFFRYLFCSIYSNNLIINSVVYLPSMSKIVMCRPLALGPWILYPGLSAVGQQLIANVQRPTANSQIFLKKIGRAKKQKYPGNHLQTAGKT